MSMSAPPSIASVAPAFHPMSDTIRPVLETSGYRIRRIRLGGTHHLPPGCRVSLQFGDLVATSASGATQLTVRCSAAINGGDELVGGVTSWHIRKDFDACASVDPLNLAIEADLLVGRGLSPKDVLPHVGDIAPHLHRLVLDLRTTLQELPVRDGDGVRASLPVLRIEAGFVGDLSIGRSGIVSPRTSASSGPLAAPRLTARDRRVATAACDCLIDDVLPDFTRALQGAVPGWPLRGTVRSDAVDKHDAHQQEAVPIDPFHQSNCIQ